MIAFENLTNLKVFTKTTLPQHTHAQKKKKNVRTYQYIGV